MMSATTRDKLEFVYAMAKHSTATHHDCQRLLRYGATYQRLMTDACNVPNLGERYLRKVERTKAAIRKLCDSFGCTAKLSGDPRGCTVKVTVPDGYANDFDNEGICVPTA